MTELGIADPVNITGMGFLIDTTGSVSDFDPQALEQEIVRGAAAPVIGAEKKRSLAEEFARDIGEITPKVPIRFEAPKPVSADPFGSMDGVGGEDADLLKLLDVSTASPDPFVPPMFSPPTSHPSQLSHLTHEERRQQIINQAYSTPSTSATMFSIEKERDDDEKARDLEQIASLLEILQDEGEDVSKIPKVTHANTKLEIKTVLRHLILKNDRKRCGSFAEECILLGVHGIEWIFDGKKQYFGQTLDMKDWHKTVQTKLRRMRHDTAAAVGNVMTELGLGSGTRLIMELLPSAFLYSRMRRSQTRGQVTDDEFADATNRMRDYEKPSN